MATITETVALSSVDYNPWTANTTNNTNTSGVSSIDEFDMKSEGAFDDRIIPPMSATIFNSTSMFADVTRQVNIHAAKGLTEYSDMDGGSPYSQEMSASISTIGLSYTAAQVDASKIGFITPGVDQTAVFDQWHKPIVLANNMDTAHFSGTEITTNTNTSTTVAIIEFGMRSEGDRDTQVNPPVSAAMFDFGNVVTAGIVTRQAEPHAAKGLTHGTYDEINPSFIGSDDYTNVARAQVEASKIGFITPGVHQTAVFDNWHKPIVLANKMDVSEIVSNTAVTTNTNTSTQENTNPMWYKKPGSSHGLVLTYQALQTDFTIPPEALGYQYWD